MVTTEMSSAMKSAKKMRFEAYIRMCSAIGDSLETRHDNKVPLDRRTDIRDRLYTARDAYHAAVTEPDYLDYIEHLNRMREI